MRKTADRIIARLTLIAVVILYCLPHSILAEGSVALYARAWDARGDLTGEYLPGDTVPSDAGQITFGASVDRDGRYTLRVDGRLSFSAVSAGNAIELDPEDLRAFGLIGAGDHRVEVLDASGAVLASGDFVIGTVPVQQPTVEVPVQMETPNVTTASPEPSPTPVPTPTPSPTPTPTPAPLEDIRFTMDGVDLQGDTLVSEDKLHPIYWYAKNASAYRFTLKDAEGKTVHAQDEGENRYMVNPGVMEYDTWYTVSFEAMPEHGNEYQTVRSARLMRPMGEIRLWVDDDQVTNPHTLTEGEHALSWQADGAVQYSAALTTPDGEQSILSENRACVIDTRQLQPGRYTVTLTAQSEHGEPQNRDFTLICPEPSPTPSPLSDFEIKVDGEPLEGDLYLRSASRMLTFEADNAAAYSISIVNADGETLYSAPAELPYFELTKRLLEEDGIYTLSIGVQPQYGGEDDWVWKSVRVVRPRTLGPIDVRIDDQEASDQYILNEGDHVLTWSADGGASYSVVIQNSRGVARYQRENLTDGSLQFNTDALERDVEYTVTVTATPQYGTEQDQQTASLKIIIPMPVEGLWIRMDERDAPEGTLLLEQGEHSVAWDADGASFYAYSITDEYGNIIRNAERLEKGSFQFKADELERDMTYTVNVGALPRYGSDALWRSFRILWPSPVGAIEPRLDGDEFDDLLLLSEPEGVLTWDAGNAASYAIRIECESGEVLVERAELEKGLWDLGSLSLEAGETYTVTLSAMSRYDIEPRQRSFTLIWQKPLNNIEMDISGDSDLRYDGELLLVDQGDWTFRWKAENAATFGLRIADSYGNTIAEEKELERGEYTVDASALEKDMVYTLTASAAPRFDQERSAVYTDVRFVSPNPVGEVELWCDGQTVKNDSLSTLSEGTHAITWFADGAKTFRVRLEDTDGNVLYSDDSLNQNVYQFSANDLPERDVVYLFSVGLSPRYGTEEDTVWRTLKLVYPTPLGKLSTWLDGREVGSVETLSEGEHELRWTAEGAASYMVKIALGDGTVLSSQAVMENGVLNFNTDDLEKGVPYFISIGALPHFGSEEDISWQTLQITCVSPTPEPTAEPTPVPTVEATPEPVYSLPAYAALPVVGGDNQDYVAGNVVTMGQDEFGSPLNWVVLKVNNGMALLYCTRVVARLPYSEGTPNWGNSTVRQYLNDDFLKAFSSEEQSRIIEISNGSYLDKVFLLNEDQLEDVPESARTSSEEKRWVLVMGGLSTGAQHAFEYMEKAGNIRSGGTIGAEPMGVQPAMWVSVTDTNSQAGNLSADSQPGEFVRFGAYGPQPIEWIVLNSDGARKVLISRYLLDAQPYNETLTPTCWADCSLRAWLEDDFMPRVFGKKQQDALLTVSVENGVGGETQDKIWLLSSDEAMTCFEKMTAAAQPIVSILEYVDSYNAWWLRDVPGDQMGSQAFYCQPMGEAVNYFTADVYNQYADPGETEPRQFGVRPVICVDTAKLG